MANQPNNPPGWILDPIRKDYYRAQQNSITGTIPAAILVGCVWLTNHPLSHPQDNGSILGLQSFSTQSIPYVSTYILRLISFSSTPRSASNVTPLATHASQLPQSDYRTGNTEQSRYLSGANGNAYEAYGTDAITNRFAALPADLGEPWQTRRQGSEQPHASRGGTETRPADPRFSSRRPSASYSSHPQLLQAQIGYGSGQAGYQPLAQVSRHPTETSFAEYGGNTSTFSTRGKNDQAEVYCVR